MTPEPKSARIRSAAAVGLLAVAGVLPARTADDAAPAVSATNAPPQAAAEASPTNGPAPARERRGRAEPAAPADPSTFVRFVTDRNIFDPDRRARGAGESRRGPERPRNTVTPTLTLVGVMESGRGRLAFFDGPSPEYRKTVGTNRSVAGFTVAQIRDASVVLRPKEGAEFELALGKAHRLDGAEPVEAPAGSGSVSSDGGAPADNTPPAGASGDAADVLRKLMQKREQESK